MPFLVCTVDKVVGGSANYFTYSSIEVPTINGTTRTTPHHRLCKTTEKATFKFTATGLIMLTYDVSVCWLLVPFRLYAITKNTIFQFPITTYL